MHQADALGGNADSQTPRRAGLSGGPATQPTIHSSTNVLLASGHSAPRVLLTTAQAARDVFGVSERKFQQLRGEPWMPSPVVLGPRLVRWVRGELEQAAMSIPRNQTVPEPVQLLRGKIERLKRAGVAAGVPSVK